MDADAVTLVTVLLTLVWTVIVTVPLLLGSATLVARNMTEPETEPARY